MNALIEEKKLFSLLGMEFRPELIQESIAPGSGVWLRGTLWEKRAQAPNELQSRISERSIYMAAQSLLHLGCHLEKRVTSPP